MSIEAMKQARDFISRLKFADAEPEPEIVMTVLDQAIAEAEKQEPVAWMHNHIKGNVIAHRPVTLDRHPEHWTALYPEPKTCPTCEALARTVMLDQTSHDTPPQRQPLTDEDLIECERLADIRHRKHMGSIRGQQLSPADQFLWHYARAIEAAHGIMSVPDGKGEA